MASVGGEVAGDNWDDLELTERWGLSWITTLGELFADTVKPMHPAWEKVTLRQVLAHRAGLRHEPDGPGVFSVMN